MTSVSAYRANAGRIAAYLLQCQSELLASRKEVEFTAPHLRHCFVCDGDAAERRHRGLHDPLGDRSAGDAVGVGQVGLYIENGSAMDEVDAAEMQRVANDAVKLYQGEADGVGAVGRARAEQTDGFAAKTWWSHLGAHSAGILLKVCSFDFGEGGDLVCSFVRLAVFVFAWKRYINHTWLYSCSPSRLSLG